MIRIVVVLLVAALMWMFWWAFGQVAYEKGLNIWVDDRRAEGWIAEFTDLSTRGFPNRFDTTISDVSLADPETGIAWTAPFVQFLSLSYRPNEVIAVLPDQHHFSTPVQTMTFTHDIARASLFLEPSANLPLSEARLVVDQLSINSTKGWDVALNYGRFAAEKLLATTDVYRIGAEVLELTPTKETLQMLDPAGLLPKVIESLRIDAELAFTAPWDRNAIEQARPQITRIELSEFSARWGDVTFRAVGKLSVSPDGTPEGRITLRAEEWHRILEMAVAAGFVPESLQGPLEVALGLLSGQSDKLDAPLDLSGGRISLGPIPLGPVPRIAIR